jgi:hypothetical protein
MLCSKRSVGAPEKMTLAMASDIVVEYDLQCFCGALIVTTEKTVTCANCGRVLGVRRVKKRHRQYWINAARRRNGTKGWRWRRNVVESLVERTFRLQCACGTSIVTSEKAATCTACGEEIEVRRVLNCEQPEVIVRYDFDCCFCGTPIVTTEKTVTCANCHKALEIARVGTHRQYWKVIPSLTSQDTLEQGEAGEPVRIMLSLSLGGLFVLLVYLGQYLYTLR